MGTERLELADRHADGAVPPPLPPDDPEAWYAPDVRSQTEVHPGVVVTIRETNGGFTIAWEAETRDYLFTDHSTATRILKK